MKRISIVIILFLFSGCVTRGHYKEMIVSKLKFNSTLNGVHYKYIYRIDSNEHHSFRLYSNEEFEPGDMVESTIEYHKSKDQQ